MKLLPPMRVYVVGNGPDARMVDPLIQWVDDLDAAEDALLRALVHVSAERLKRQAATHD